MPMNHDLYKTGDEGAPEQILDGSGEVVLGLCKKCNAAEAQLDGPCDAEYVLFIDRLDNVAYSLRRIIDDPAYRSVNYLALVAKLNINLYDVVMAAEFVKKIRKDLSVADDEVAFQKYRSTPHTDDDLKPGGALRGAWYAGLRYGRLKK